MFRSKKLAALALILSVSLGGVVIQPAQAMRVRNAVSRHMHPERGFFVHTTHRATNRVVYRR